MPRFKLRKLPYMLQFNGGNPTLTKAAPSGLNTGTQDRSVIMWVFQLGSASQSAIDIHVGGGNPSWSLSMGLFSGNWVWFSDRVFGGNNQSLSRERYENNQPPYRLTRLGMSYKGSTGVTKLYANGRLVTTVTLGIPLNTGTIAELLIGYSKGSNGAILGYSTAAFADFVYANATLSDNDFLLDYTQEVLPASVAMRVKMDEGAGGTCNDSIGSNHMTAANTSWVNNLAQGSIRTSAPTRSTITRSAMASRTVMA